MKKIIIIPFVLLLSSCFTKTQIVKTPNLDNNSKIYVEDTKTHNLILEKEKLIANYKASNTIINDLINTKLYLSFNYKKKQVIGKAEILLKPHYYSTDSLTLDAQSFKIQDVFIKKEEGMKVLEFKYKKSKLNIKLDKEYTRNDSYTILINYIAKPDDILKSGSRAIHENKGLYFIDSKTDNPQIWTQGETQSNSAWFPTIDAPNQKMTQEIFLTVNKEFQTLSNGKLISSLLNNDGTRTDYWKQTKPHAPYLAMIAVGKFNISKDYWRDLPINIYTEDGDEDKAKELYRNTSEMIEFYSRKLNYDFPWDKYSQIVVRDFVSGAMENTGAVVFGDYILRYSNEEERIEYESVVAHELSHHWFGDLVTCESWANLPLNESFATYFEYLWIEHQYGRYYADKHIADDYRSYNFEHIYKDENLIRFYNKHRDNMFDAHSYQKGGMILHMLRYTVGDNAFWDALELYLKTNEFKAVEIHHLRLAFEEVTGQDLNWFFNQWFLSKGIPILNIEYSYDEVSKKANVKIEQIQDLKNTQLYKIPTFIDFYFEDKTVRKKIEINQQTENFTFQFLEKPLAINFDPENSILCKKKENYSIEEYIEILANAPLYKDKKEALKELKFHSSKRLNEVYLKLCKNEYWEFRYDAISRLNISDTNGWTEKTKTKYLDILEDVSENDSTFRVKKLALKILDKKN